jgi:hypothetical protein
MKRWRIWAERGVFVASVLALLATSKAKGWSLAATVTGPTTPAATKALSLSIDASHASTIYAKGIPLTFSRGMEAPCLATFTPGKAMTCLLPPGATLDAVEIHGSCGGGCNDPCTVPAGAYGKVETKEVDVSIDGDTKTMPASLPSHGKGFIASRIEVKVSGASFAKAHMTVRPRGGGAALFDVEQTCAPTCIALVYDSSLGAVHDVDVTVEATGYEACATPGCAPPKTFHIDSVSLMP